MYVSGISCMFQVSLDRDPCNRILYYRKKISNVTQKSDTTKKICNLTAKTFAACVVEIPLHRTVQREYRNVLVVRNVLPVTDIPLHIRPFINERN